VSRLRVIFQVTLANARAIFAVNRRRTLYLGAGLGAVARTGAVWRGVGGTTQPAIALSAGAREQLRSRLSMRLEIEDYITTTRGQERSWGHHDVLWSVGMMFRL